MTMMSQRDLTVRPRRQKSEQLVAPIQEEADDFEAEPERSEEAVVDNGDEHKQWQEIQNRVEDLNVRVARQFEDANDNTGWSPPMIRPPPQPTKNEWLQHQLTHTPYAPWCKHCSSARAVRNNHQKCIKES